MLLSLAAIVGGLLLLVWSADRFVAGSSAVARQLGMSPLLIGMVVVGFGTSAPELLVSGLAAWQGNAGLALGNAYGSNITNIALILGLTALISPIAVHSRVLRRELPLLAAATALAAWQLRDGVVSRPEAVVLLAAFAGLMAWMIGQGRRAAADSLAGEVAAALPEPAVPLRRALSALCGGLVLLVTSSRVLVWGAVAVARSLGVSDLVVGLTIVAVGTSLPELASSVVAARRREHDIALGNIIGSNLFNTLAVVGLAGTIRPLAVGPEVLSRDLLVVGGLTVVLAFFVAGFRGPGRINRVEGGALLAGYVAYTWLLLRGSLGS